MAFNRKKNERRALSILIENYRLAKEAGRNDRETQNLKERVEHMKEVVRSGKT